MAKKTSEYKRVKNNTKQGEEKRISMSRDKAPASKHNQLQ